MGETYQGFLGKVLIQAATAVLTAFSEVATLGCILALVSAVASNSKSYTFSLPAGASTFTMTVPQLLLISVIAIVARTALQVFGALLATRISTGFLASQQERIYLAYSKSSWAKQSAERSGHLQVLMTSEAEVAMKALTAIGTGAVAMANFLILAGSAVAVNVICALSIIVIGIFLFAIIRPISVIARRLAARKVAELSQFFNRVNQGILLSRELRVFNVSEAFAASVVESIWKVRKYRTTSLFLGNIIPIVYQNCSFLIVVAGMAAVFWFQITNVSSLVLIVLLLVRAIGYSQNFQTVYHQITEALPHLSHLRAAIDKYDSDRPSADGNPIRRILRVEFDNVGFSYDGAMPVLTNACFDVTHGQVIGIVGPSGSGKTTLLQLLLRLRRPTAGQIRINGLPSEEVELASWFDRVAIVPQEPMLFDHSIIECIRFFRPRITDEEVRAAAQQAGIHDDILKLANGYETLAGERGSQLSGGQRQRVCIARALAGDPDVIVLDEPTSALDGNSEAIITRTLTGLRGKRTVFVIAHRTATLSSCDRLLEVCDGHVRTIANPYQRFYESSRDDTCVNQLSEFELSISNAKRKP